MTARKQGMDNHGRPGTPTRTGFRGALPMLLLLCAAVAAIYPELLTNANAPGGDGQRILPYVEYIDHTDSLFPLWNPCNNAGTPTLATPERFTWLGWIMDADWPCANLAVNLLLLAATTLAAWTVFLLGRELDLSRLGALTSSLAMLLVNAYSEALLSSGRLQPLLALAATMAAVTLYMRHMRTGRLAPLVGAGLLSGFVVANISHFFLLGLGPLFAILGLHHNLRKHSLLEGALRVLGQGAFVAAVGTAAWAFLLFPLLGYQLHLAAVTKPATTFHYLGPAAMLRDLSPLMAIPLAMLGMAAARRPLFSSPAHCLALFFALAGLFAAMPWFFGHLTGMLGETPLLWHFRHNFVFIMPMAMMAPLLLGFGVDALAGRLPLGRRRAAMLTVLVALAAYLAHGHGVIPSSGWWLAAIPLLALPIPWLTTRPRLAAYVLLLALMQACALDSKALYYGQPRRDLARTKQFLRADPDHFRVLATDMINYPSTNLPAIPSLAGFSLYFSPEQRRLFSLLGAKSPGTSRPHWAGLPGLPEQLHPAIVPLANIKYVATERNTLPNWPLVLQEETFRIRKGNRRKPVPSTVRLYRNPGWADALRVYSRWAALDGPEAVMRAMRAEDFNPWDTLYVEKDPRIPAGTADAARPGTARIVAFRDDSLRIEVDAPDPGLLFLPEIWDAGWRATVDGEEAEVLRADACFRAVPIREAGRHVVRMRYRPASFVAGVWVSVLGCGLMALWLVVSTRRRRDQTEPAP